MNAAMIPLIGLIFLVAFVLITMGELWFLQRLGFDLFGHLKFTYTQGKSVKFFFEAFGAIAFIMVQPVLLAWLTGQISAELQKYLQNVLAVIGGGSSSY